MTRKTAPALKMDPEHRNWDGLNKDQLSSVMANRGYPPDTIMAVLDAFKMIAWRKQQLGL